MLHMGDCGFILDLVKIRKIRIKLITTKLNTTRNDL